MTAYPGPFNEFEYPDLPTRALSVRTLDLLPGDTLDNDDGTADQVVSISYEGLPCVVAEVRALRSASWLDSNVPVVRFAGVEAIHQVIR